MWDVAARYAGEFAGFKVAAAAAYSRVSDENLAIPSLGQRDKDVGYFQAGLYIQHVPTGLFAYGAYGKEFGDVNYAGLFNADVDGNHWYLKAGIRQRWTSLGHTVLYGEYGQMNDMYNPALEVFGTNNSQLTKWGLGVVQEIDAAAMSLWVSYRHYDGDYSGAYGSTDGPIPFSASMDDVHYVKAGALINF